MTHQDKKYSYEEMVDFPELHQAPIPKKKKCFVCGKKVYDLNAEGICEKDAEGFREARMASLESARQPLSVYPPPLH